MPPSPPPTADRRSGRPAPTVSVVIPALDEAGNLPLILDSIPRFVDEVVVVDDGSSGDAVAAACDRRPGVVAVRQTRSGRGNALVCGVAASSGDIVVTLDAGGRADPGELSRHVQALTAGAEVAHGSRYRTGGGDQDASRLGRLGNTILCWLVNVLFGARYTDLGCGYDGFWRESFAALDLPPADLPRPARGRPAPGDGPESVPLITVRMAAQGLRVVEVPCTGYPPIHGAPRRPLRAGWRALRTVRAEWARRRRLARRPAAAPRHDAGTRPGYATGRSRPGPATAGRTPRPARRPAAPDPRPVRPAVPDPAPYVVGERTTGRHAAPLPRPGTAAPDPGVRHSGIYDTGTHQRVEPWESGVHRTGVYDTAVRRSGLYDTGVHRFGRFDSGVHRTEVYDSGVHELPDGTREVGGGRRRLDARDLRADDDAEPRAVPGERSTR